MSSTRPASEPAAAAGSAAEPDRWRVVVLDPIEAEGLAPLLEDSRIDVVHRHGLQGEEQARALADADAVLVRSMSRITRASLAHADRLRVIGRAGVGVDNIDVDAATERGIAVLNAPSGNTISAAELTMALLLALVRRVPGADSSMRAGRWDRKSFQGSELHGKTLGLIGAGRIGAEVAKRAQGFGMRVVAFDPFLRQERARALDIQLCSDLDDVLRRADVLSLHTPLTESTARMIGDEQLARLPRGAYLVNAARGGVVDELALVRALESGQLAGAALDVFEQEPLPPEHPLRGAPNTVLSPHLGAATREAQRNVAVEIAVLVRAALVEGDYSQAVNTPEIAGEELRRLRPLLDLSRRLGLLARALLDGALRHVEVRYSGEAEEPLRLLAAAGLSGVLASAMGRGAVNIVNAMHIAESRAISVRHVWEPARADYAEYVELRLEGAAGHAEVGGAVMGEHQPRVVWINGYRVDVRPRGTLLVLRNQDVPGVIGRVGTLLGEAGLNIAEYHQARRRIGGEALAAVTLDARAGAALLKRLGELPDVIDVREVELE
jgi:D-3-phosphoglycerate dehydrogenase / 2-oxoglutarate reductase